MATDKFKINIYCTRDEQVEGLLRIRIDIADCWGQTKRLFQSEYFYEADLVPTLLRMLINLRTIDGFRSLRLGREGKARILAIVRRQSAEDILELDDEEIAELWEPFSGFSP